MKFKVGTAGMIGKPKATDPVGAVVELMNMCKAQDMDAMTFPFMPPRLDFGFNEQNVAEVAAAKKEMGFGYTVICPGTVFKNLAGYDKATALKFPEQAMKFAKILGEKFVRISYGRLDLDTTRYNINIPIDQHLQILVEGIKSIIPLCEQYDIDILIENHCDFTGGEIAQVIEMVDSKYAGIYIDTGNAATVWVDPVIDNHEMWPYMRHAGHVKDVKGRLDPENVNSSGQGRFPVQLVGTYLGEGIVPLQGMIDYLNAHGKPEDEFYLQLEALWGPKEFDMNKYMADGVKYLRKITGTAK